MKWYAIIFILILAITNTSAVSIGTGIIFNTTETNSSMTFSIPANIDNITINPDNIFLDDVSIFRDGKTYFCDFINYTRTNENLDSFDFPCSADSRGHGVIITDDETFIIIEPDEIDPIFKLILLAVLFIVLILVAIVTDILRRNKKISILTQVLLIILVSAMLTAVAMIIVNLSSENIMTGIIIICGMIILIVLTIIIDIMRKKKKIGILTQVGLVVLLTAVLVISGFLVRDVILNQSAELTRNMLIIAVGGVLALIIGLVVDFLERFK